jgi:F-type H+-transporting ATPase subunit gamma
MEMVSAAKLQKSEHHTTSYRDYMETLREMVRNISGTDALRDHAFFRKSRVRKPGYLVITSDRGLAGGYNANVLKLMQGLIDEDEVEEYRLYMVGGKGFEYARRHGLSIENEEIYIPEEPIYNDIRTLIEQLLADFAAGTINEIIVIYNEYLSKLTQLPKAAQLLPLADERKPGEKRRNYLMIPGEAYVVERFLPKYVEGIIYGKLMNAKLSEQASRMNAMQSATDNAKGIIKDLQLIYNRARQAAITQEINEIVGGASAL